MPSYKEIETSLDEKNYVELPFPLGKEDFDRAAQAFFGFIDLPQDVKEELKNIDEVHASGGSKGGWGYIKKIPYRPDLDKKDKGIGALEVFHFHPMLLQRYDDKKISSHKVGRTFLEEANKVYSAAFTIATAVLNVFDDSFPGFTDNFHIDETSSWSWRSTLRFVKYESCDKENFIAKGHYDKAAFTMALAESAPGLRIGAGPSSLTATSRDSQHVLFMPSYGFPKLVRNRFRPSWHDVIQSSHDHFRNDTARWAIVFFMSAKQSKFMTRYQSITPLEE